jgi:carboxypeptidase family protein
MTTNLSSQQPATSPGESTVVGALANVRGLLERVPRLNVNLSMFQTVVGLTAGFVSILGALLAVPNYFKPAIGKGEVVAVVVDAKTEKAVSNATVEILTLNNAVVTTVNSGFFGKASSTLEEGQYRIRVKHPKFGAEVRHVQVVSGQSAEVRVQLRSGAPAPLHEAERVIGEGVNAVKRLFGN